MLLSYIIWDIDPVMFHLGNREIRWYGLLLALGFLFAYLIMGKITRKEGFKQEFVDKFSIYLLLGTVIGLRLGHCLFYGPYFDFVDEFGVFHEGYLSHPFNILKIWEGGLASHGGAIGILLAVWLFYKNNKNKTDNVKISYLGLLDRVVLIVPLAGSMVRLGNLMNSEIYGIPTDVPWAFIFKRLHGLNEIPLHPTQLYEAIFYLIMFFAFFFIYKKFHSKWRDGTFLGWFLIVLFGFRFLIEFTKVDQVEFQNWTDFIKMGQLLSIPFILIGLFFIGREYGWFKKNKNKK